MRVGRRLATAIAVLLWVPAALADAVERVFAPSNEGQCQEAWDRNTRTADRLGQETNDCRLDCANRAIASYGTSAYSNVCGGEIPNLDPIAIAGYERCRPLQRRHDDFMHAKKEAYDDCVQAVHNVQAAQTVYRASRDNTKYPDELSPGRTAADEAGDQVSTGNPVVDRYRREASDGAANATSSLSSKALEDLSNAVDGNPTQSKSAYSRCREVPIDKRQDCLYRNLRQQGDPND